ncbi:iron-containing redox enzyme family protein [Neptuniibacter sp. QD37_11]|uniref:iron-containing redox enzyme family protein n=1 Tax=Neptuniibacter sp. QD37_11 TaxID=3398209 RepID=UPI0039F4FDC5
MTTYNWAKSKTLELAETWAENDYVRFMHDATREEFLKSQLPFYHAVNAFPVMLLTLATKIKTSEERLLLIDNIWEEHGQGDTKGFHTNSFKTHLRSLGWNQCDEIQSNPFISEWIENTLRISNPRTLGSYLAGIEYIYAIISQSIAEQLESYELECEQAHYSKHAVLDWDHGYELLKTVELTGEEIDKEAFERAQREFIHLFSKMVVPTLKELNQIGKMPVAFYYSREDSKPELFALKNVEKKAPAVLAICSGGEHLINLLNSNPHSVITAVDANPQQIAIAKNKVHSLGSKTTHETAEGKFEAMFALIRRYFKGTNGQLNEKEILTHIEKRDFVVRTVLSNSNLTAVFGEDATRYSTGDFAEHFVGAFNQSLEAGHPNILNVLLNMPIQDPCKAKGIRTESINYVECVMNEFRFDKKYDVIDLSNIGDWMPIDDYRSLINKAFLALNGGGQLILRKLMGDYDLYSLTSQFNKTTPFKDGTCFYQQTVVAEKAAA